MRALLPVRLWLSVRGRAPLAKHFIWDRRGWDFDIVAYQIVGIEGAQ
jgi:hypothetical protein